MEGGRKEYGTWNRLNQIPASATGSLSLLHSSVLVTACLGQTRLMVLDHLILQYFRAL